MKNFDIFMQYPANDKFEQMVYNGEKKGGDRVKKYVYDGDAYDKYNYASPKFLVVASCGVHVNVDHITERRTGRADYHLLYVESGEMVCELDGRDIVLSPGGYVLYLPNERQKYEQNGGVCYWVHFSGTAACEILTDAGLKGNRFFCGDRPHKPIIDSFERMIYRYMTGGHRNDLSLSAELIALLSNFKYRIAEDKEQQIDERLCAVINYLNKHFYERLDIDQCAQMLCLSSGRFAHIFKDSTGVSPYAYVLNLRMEKAAELLALSCVPVAEVAYKVGFDNPLYFSKMFKKQYGVSPTVFRKEKWKNIPRRVDSSGCD